MKKDVPALRISERLATGIELGESHFREFKSAFDRRQSEARPRDMKLVCRDIAETLVAFANADGGELYVGIEDDGTVTGVPHAEELVSIFLSAPRTHVLERTALPNPTALRVTHADKTVLYFQVAKSTLRVHLTSDGRCLQRFDRENRPVAVEDIQYNRQEQQSREYDRAFIDGASMEDLDLDMIEKISRHIAGGQSPERFLQHMDVAEYGGDGVRLRRAALLLFAKDIVKWHPRCEVRILRVSGTALGVGKEYNVDPRDDQTVRANVLNILENTWDTLRPYLARTRLAEGGIFRESLVYPEHACREALINAVAHRDYGIEGKGIEIFVYDDRLEVKSPGGLLSSISIDDLRTGKRTHQSRNVYVARVLRELGYMREIGEGMLRIFSEMRDQDLVPPEVEANGTRFDIILHHRSVFSPKDQEWLKAYSPYNLSRDEQRAILLGRDGHSLSTSELMKTLGIVDTDQFRQFIEKLRRKGILYSTRRAGGRDVGRFGIRPPDQTEQYRDELIRVLRGLGIQPQLSNLLEIKEGLSRYSPYRENLADSLKLLGFVDKEMRPLPLLIGFWRDGGPAQNHVESPKISGDSSRMSGTIIRLKAPEGYGFIGGSDSRTYFFHKTDLLGSAWKDAKIGLSVMFEPAGRLVEGKAPPAKNVKVIGPQG